MDEASEFPNGQLDNRVILLFYFSCFIFAEQADSQVNIFICLVVQLSGTVKEKRVGGTVQLITIERSDERFLLIVHFRFFDNVDILFFQFFHDRSERFFKLFIVTVVQFTYLFQCVRSDFLFFLYILVVILYNPV